MTKVIGHDEKVIRKCTCQNCGAIIEYNNQDIQVVSGTDYGGFPDGREFIVCPECKKEVVLRSW